MSVANEVHTGAIPGGPRQAVHKVKTAPWWQRPAVFRYGFLALILVVWQIVGPQISPIFFTYPSKIAVAFYQLTVNGDLPYYLSQSLEVMFYGLLSALQFSPDGTVLATGYSDGLIVLWGVLE